MGALRENLGAIRERIARACGAVGRSPDEVTLVAVSKTYPASAIAEAYDLGLRHFGESRLQEALPKIEALPKDIVWHFIGRLQSNKTRRVVESFDVVHTFCDEKQIREAAKASKSVEALVEVNVAQEPQKSGLFVGELDVYLRMLIECPQAQFRGLMTIGPALDDPEQMRPFFRKLRESNQRLGGRWLSMGMSSDFEQAIQEGATHIRVGTALFGARE